MFFFFASDFADVFNSSMWTDLRAAVPKVMMFYSHLRNLSQALASRAPSTSFKYSSTHNRWKSWTCDHGLTAFPASPFHVALYLRHLMSEAKTASSPPFTALPGCISWVESGLLRIIRW